MMRTWLLAGWLGALPAAGAAAQPVARPVVAGPLAIVELRGPAAVPLSEAGPALAAQFGLGPADELRAAAPTTDALGFAHVRFQQFYRGVRVEAAVGAAHGRHGRVETLSGQLAPVPTTLAAAPRLSAAAAWPLAGPAAGAHARAWEETPADRAPLVPARPAGELVVTRAEAGPWVLAWRFDCLVPQPLGRAAVYVDAATGEVVRRDELLAAAATATGPGTLDTRYSGPRAAATDAFAGAYRLRDYTRGQGIETLDCQHTFNFAGSVDFTDADNAWTAAEYDNANLDNAALDVHWAMQQVYDYWLTVFGRRSWDGNGAKITSYVHVAVNYNTAGWFGSFMAFGDGTPGFTKPAVALDICAHEIGHGVCQSTAGLGTAGEPGALNEGLADIWGACVERRAAPEKQTWLIGEETSVGQPAVRSLSNPHLLGHPAYYQGQYWDAGGRTHANCTVLGHWFYILSEGKTGVNEAGNAYRVTGLGIDAAARIVFRAESVYCTPGTTYAGARLALIQAAKDLHGTGSAAEIAATNAWYAVGVGAAYVSTPLSVPAAAFAPALAVGTFPNPAPGAAAVQVLAPAAGLAQGRVLDALGRVRQRFEERAVAGANRWPVEWRLPPGVYWLEVCLNGQTVRTRLARE